MESDHESSYPTLISVKGNPFEHIPKKVLAVSTNGSTAEEIDVIYLLSFKQDYQRYFYTPTFTSGVILEALELDDLLFDFYQANL